MAFEPSRECMWRVQILVTFIASFSPTPHFLTFHLHKTDHARDRQEFLSIFVSYLSSVDLLVCVQVSTQWNLFFILMLWHTIDTSFQSWEKILTARSLSILPLDPS